MDKKVYSISKLHTITDYVEFTKKASGVLIRLGYRGNKSGGLALDPKFEEFYGNLSRTGVPIGIHFFTNAINESEAKEEADFIAAAISKYELDLKFPVLINSDYARNDKQGRADALTKAKRTSILATIIRELKQHGYKAALYSTETWFNSVIDVNQTKDYNKVVVKTSGLTKPKVNSNMIAWEYKIGKIKGCDRDLKISHWYGDISTEAFLVKVGPVIVEPVEEPNEEPVAEEPIVAPEPGFDIRVPGTELQLEDVEVYANSLTSDPAATVSGTFYTWDNKVLRDRIRITDDINKVGVADGFIGWVYVETVTPEE